MCKLPIKMSSDADRRSDLPVGWIARRSRKHPNNVYYFNVQTGCSTWDKPILSQNVQSSKPPAGSKRNQSENFRESCKRKKFQFTDEEKTNIIVKRNCIPQDSSLKRKKESSNEEEGNQKKKKTEEMRQLSAELSDRSDCLESSSSKINLFGTSSGRTVPPRLGLQKKPVEEQAMETHSKKRRKKTGIAEKRLQNLEKKLSEERNERLKVNQSLYPPKKDDERSTSGIAEKRLQNLEKKLSEERNERLKVNQSLYPPKKDDNRRSTSEIAAKRMENAQKKLEVKHTDKLGEFKSRVPPKKEGAERSIPEIAKKRLTNVQNKFAVEHTDKLKEFKSRVPPTKKGVEGSVPDSAEKRLTNVQNKFAGDCTDNLEEFKSRVPLKKGVERSIPEVFERKLKNVQSKPFEEYTEKLKGIDSRISPVKEDIQRSTKGIAERRLKNIQKQLAEEHIEKLKESTVFPKEKAEERSILEIGERRLKNVQKQLAEEHTEKFKESTVFPKKKVEEKIIPDMIQLEGNLTSYKQIQNQSRFESTMSACGTLQTSETGQCIYLEKGIKVEEVEAMEWEPIEAEKIVTHVQEVRDQIQQEGLMMDTEDISIPEVANFTFSSIGKEDLIIVLDTNILLGLLQCVQELLSYDFEGVDMPVLIIPMQVIQELDHIKDNKRGKQPDSVVWAARQAIRYLHSMLELRHPRLQGQSIEEYYSKEIFDSRKPDDSILKCFIQVSKKSNKGILVTNDKNLRNKAILSGIEAHPGTYLEDMVQKFNSAKVKKTHIFAKIGKDVTQTKEIQDMKKNDEICKPYILKLRNVLLVLLSKIFENEMFKAYGDVWKKMLKFKPPWTLPFLLKCYLKHWKTVFEIVLPQGSVSFFKTLKDTCGDVGRNSSVETVKKTIDVSLNLCRIIQTDSYREILTETISNIESLKTELTKVDVETKSLVPDSKKVPVPNEIPVPNEVPFSSQLICPNQLIVPSQDPQEMFKVILNVLEEFYSFLILFCGVMFDLLGIRHSLDYRRPEQFPSLEEVKVKFPDIRTRAEALLNSIVRIEAVPPYSLTLEHEALQQLYMTFKNCLNGPDSVTPELLLNFCTSYNARCTFEIVKRKIEELAEFFNTGSAYFGHGNVA